MPVPLLQLVQGQVFEYRGDATWSPLKAIRNVGYLLEEIVALRKRYGIVTPYRSYLAVEDTLVVANRPHPVREAGDEATASRASGSSFNQVQGTHSIPSVEQTSKWPPLWLRGPGHPLAWCLARSSFLLGSADNPPRERRKEKAHTILRALNVTADFTLVRAKALGVRLQFVNQAKPSIWARLIVCALQRNGRTHAQHRAWIRRRPTSGEHRESENCAQAFMGQRHLQSRHHDGSSSSG